MKSVTESRCRFSTIAIIVLLICPNPFASRLELQIVADHSYRPGHLKNDTATNFKLTMGPPTNSTILLSGHQASVRTVAWNITGTRLASGSSDKTIRVWNPEKPEVRY